MHSTASKNMHWVIYGKKLSLKKKVLVVIVIVVVLTIVSSHWNFSHEKFGGFSGENQLQQSRATQIAMHAECFSVSIIHQALIKTKKS